MEQNLDYKWILPYRHYAMFSDEDFVPVPWLTRLAYAVAKMAQKPDADINELSVTLHKMEGNILVTVTIPRKAPDEQRPD